MYSRRVWTSKEVIFDLYRLYNSPEAACQIHCSPWNVPKSRTSSDKGLPPGHINTRTSPNKKLQVSSGYLWFKKKTPWGSLPLSRLGWALLRKNAAGASISRPATARWRPWDLPVGIGGHGASWSIQWKESRLAKSMPGTQLGRCRWVGDTTCIDGTLEVPRSFICGVMKSKSITSSIQVVWKKHWIVHWFQYSGARTVGH